MGMIVRWGWFISVFNKVLVGVKVYCWEIVTLRLSRLLCGCLDWLDVKVLGGSNKLSLIKITGGPYDRLPSQPQGFVSVL